MAEAETPERETKPMPTIREHLELYRMIDPEKYQSLLVRAYRNGELRPKDEIPTIIKDTMMECLLLANDASRLLRDNDDPYERGWTDGAAKAGDNIRLAMEMVDDE